MRLLLLFSLALLNLPLDSRADDLTLGFGGDLGLASSGLNSTESAANQGGSLIPLPALVSGIRPLWDADLNFANLEAVLTSQPLRAASGKTYVFRTQPQALALLVAQGLNLFSTANNHAYDYLDDGAVETSQNLASLCAGDKCHSSGVGRDLDEALSVQVFEVKGHRIAFAAIGILSENNPKHRAGPGKPGTASYRNLHSDTRSGEDYDALLAKLKATDAELKILSIHFGTEGQTALDAGQREDYLRAFTQGDVDVVLGHHAHVVRPWELVQVDGRMRAVFYGLGNYLHLGTSDIASRRDGKKDYGLFGKLYFSLNPMSRRLEAQALKLQTLTDTHLKARPHSPSESALRLRLLNELNRSSLGASASIAEIVPSGYGRACFGVAPGTEARALCR